MNIRRHRPAEGFTLIEILAALAVMVIAMAALWKGLAQGISVSQGLSDRIQARWVAQNRIEMRQIMREWPDARTYEGTEEMGGRTWYWSEQIATTPQPEMRSITVSVGLMEKSSLLSLSGMLHQPRGTPLVVPGGQDGSG